MVAQSPDGPEGTGAAAGAAAGAAVRLPMLTAAMALVSAAQSDRREALSWRGSSGEREMKARTAASSTRQMERTMVRTAVRTMRSSCDHILSASS